MTYFPLFSIPVYQDAVSGSYEVENGKVTDNLYRHKAWGTVESKACTIATLVISSIIGGALISIGCVGLCVSNFYIHPGICITSILFGVALMVPSVIAWKLGFKPDGSSEFKPDDSGESVPTNREPMRDRSMTNETNIEQEKAEYGKLVPQGCYAKFHLSNGHIYYHGVTNHMPTPIHTSVEVSLLEQLWTRTTDRFQKQGLTFVEV